MTSRLANKVEFKAGPSWADLVPGNVEESPFLCTSGREQERFFSRMRHRRLVEIQLNYHLNSRTIAPGDKDDGYTRICLPGRVCMLRGSTCVRLSGDPVAVTGRPDLVSI